MGEEVPAVAENTEETNAETYAAGNVGVTDKEVQKGWMYNESYSSSQYEKLQIEDVKADSEQGDKGEGKDGPAAYATDGNPKTFWHSSYDDRATKRYDPKCDSQGNLSTNNTITVTIPQGSVVKGVTYLPRQEWGNGHVEQFQVQLIENGIVRHTLPDESHYYLCDYENAPNSGGYANYNQVKYEREFVFQQAYSNIDQVKFVMHRCLGFNSGEQHYINAAEIGVLSNRQVQNSTSNLALRKDAKYRYPDGSDATGRGDYSASQIVDGNQNVYSDFGDSDNKRSAYAQVDLGALKNIDYIRMMRFVEQNRIYGDTIIGVSETSDFRNPTILYNADENNVHKLGKGSDVDYTERDDGKRFKALANTQGRYVRVYMYGNTINKSNHIRELEVYGSNIDNPRDKEALYQKSLECKAINNDSYLYTNTTFDELKKQLVAAEKILNKKDATDSEVTDALTALNAAHSNLKERADYTALTEKIDMLKPRIQKSWYTDGEWWTNFENALNIVNYNQDLSTNDQAQINEYVAEIINKLDVLEEHLKPMSDINTDFTVTIDKTVKATKKYNKAIELSSADYTVPDGQEFKGWRTKEGVLLTDKPEYRFFTIGNYDLVPVFGSSSDLADVAALEGKAIITDVAILDDRDAEHKKVRFSAQIVVPTGYKLQEAGLQWNLNDELLTENRKAYITKCNRVYQFSVTMRGLPVGQTIHGKIFAKLTPNTTGQEMNIDSDERKADPSKVKSSKE